MHWRETTSWWKRTPLYSLKAYRTVEARYYKFREKLPAGRKPHDLLPNEGEYHRACTFLENAVCSCGLDDMTEQLKDPKFQEWLESNAGNHDKHPARSQQSPPGRGLNHARMLRQRTGSYGPLD